MSSFDLASSLHAANSDLMTLENSTRNALKIKSAISKVLGCQQVWKSGLNRDARDVFLGPKSSTEQSFMNAGLKFGGSNRSSHRITNTSRLFRLLVK